MWKGVLFFIFLSFSSAILFIFKDGSFIEQSSVSFPKGSVLSGEKAFYCDLLWADALKASKYIKNSTDCLNVHFDFKISPKNLIPIKCENFSSWKGKGPKRIYNSENTTIQRYFFDATRNLSKIIEASKISACCLEIDFLQAMNESEIKHQDILIGYYKPFFMTIGEWIEMKMPYQLLNLETSLDMIELALRNLAIKFPPKDKVPIPNLLNIIVVTHDFTIKIVPNELVNVNCKFINFERFRKRLTALLNLNFEKISQNTKINELRLKHQKPTPFEFDDISPLVIDESSRNSIEKEMDFDANSKRANLDFDENSNTNELEVNENSNDLSFVSEDSFHGTNHAKYEIHQFSNEPILSYEQISNHSNDSIEKFNEFSKDSKGTTVQSNDNFFDSKDLIPVSDDDSNDTIETFCKISSNLKGLIGKIDEFLDHSSNTIVISDDEQEKGTNSDPLIIDTDFKE